MGGPALISIVRPNMNSSPRPLVLITLVCLPAFLTLAPRAPQSQVGGGSLRPHEPVHPRLPEAPPEHPPAAPCGGCSDCGSGPRGIADVYLHSGELHLQEVDLEIPGRGMDFRWTRTYRSRLGRDGMQGHGWHHGYEIRIESADGDLRLMDGTGREDLFHRQTDGSYVADELFREGRVETDGSFTLTFSDTGSWHFFPLDPPNDPLAGRIRSIVDRNGNTIAFDYDGLGRLTTVVDTLGRQIQVAYGTNGRITRVTDFLGREVRYAYYVDSDAGGSGGDLKSVRSPVVVGTPNGNDFPAGKTTTYTYSKGSADEALDHNLLTVSDALGQTWMVNEYAPVTNPRALLYDRLVRQTRGDAGDVIDLTYAMQRNAAGPYLLAIVNDRVGNVKEFEYDLGGRCLALRELTGRADPDSPTTRTTNRPTTPLRPGDPPEYETRWTYNADSIATVWCTHRPSRGSATRSISS
jgi:YD repeat-containing protein